jgi:hypothetical protein
MELLGKETVNDVQEGQESKANPDRANPGQSVNPAEAIKPATDADGNEEPPETNESKIPRTVSISLKILNSSHHFYLTSPFFLFRKK